MSLDPPQIVEIALLAMLLVIAFAIVRVGSLFATAMLMGAYSLISAVWFLALDAPDVAFTEAAVGAGVSTILVLAAMLLTARQARPLPMRRRIAPLAAAIVAGGLLLYALPDLPAYGDPDSPANTGVGRDYLQRTGPDTHIPNVVTAVLASYRGHDTLGEVTVIFTAGVAVLLLLGVGRRREDRKDAAE